MKLCLVTIAWLFGILSGLYFKIGIVFLLMGSILFLRVERKNHDLAISGLKPMILLFILCYSISYFQITYLEQSFEKKYQDAPQEMKVIGTIVSNPSDKEYKTSYILKVESINGDTSYQNTKLLLHVKKQKKEKKYVYGNQICFIGTFEEPTGQRNKGGFNDKEYLKTKNIYGIITANSKEIQVKKENNSNRIVALANKIATKIEQKANTLLPKKEADIITAILIGKKENLEKEVQDTFKNSSLSHMLAISGMHVSYVIMGVGFLIEKTKIGKKTGNRITIAFLLFFMLLTGQTLSVTRACVMVIYRIVASLHYKKATVLSSITISILILMVCNPYCIFDVGLQLSYGGTIGIVLLYKRFQKIKQKEEKDEQKPIKKYLRKMQEIVKISLSANIILVPIVLYHFNTLSLTFFISNVLATPIIGVLVIGGFVSIIFSFVWNPIGKCFVLVLQFFIQLFYQIAIFTSKLPFSKIYLATPKLSNILLYYLFLFLFLFHPKIKEKLLAKIKKITRKKIIVILLLVSTLIILDKQIPKNLKIYFIDVGQGDSTLIVTPKGKTILVDGGGSKEESSFDVGESIGMPYLLDRGITKLDYVLISHFDSDHIGGLFYIMKNMKIGKVIISKQGEDSKNYEKFKTIVKEKKMKVIEVKKGDKLNIEKNIKLEILWPKEEQIQENILNNNSIVAKLSNPYCSILLTGDIEEIAEKQIVKEYKNSNTLKATILKVGHHGSRTSSIQEFLEMVKPNIALIGVGKNNTFGHPNDEVLKRLEKLRCKNLSNR